MIDRLIDEMLAAQTRFAQAWKDGVPLTKEQERDEIIRDAARSKLLRIIESQDKSYDV